MRLLADMAAAGNYVDRCRDIQGVIYFVDIPCEEAPRLVKGPFSVAATRVSADLVAKHGVLRLPSSSLASSPDGWTAR